MIMVMVMVPVLVMPAATLNNTLQGMQAQTKGNQLKNLPSGWEAIAVGWERKIKSIKENFTRVFTVENKKKSKKKKIPDERTNKAKIQQGGGGPRVKNCWEYYEDYHGEEEIEDTNDNDEHKIKITSAKFTGARLNELSKK